VCCLSLSAEKKGDKMKRGCFYISQDTELPAKMQLQGSITTAKRIEAVTSIPAFIHRGILG